MRWVALMPLRAGSRSVPRKNLRRLAGRPLFAWSLEQAILSECFDEIFVASDAQEIRDAVVSQFGAAVRAIDRSPETATDAAATESVMLEFQDRVSFDVIALVQATSPLTKAVHFQEARRKFLDEGLDSLLTAVESKRFAWSKGGSPINYNPVSRPRRQDFGGMFIENGAFYLTKAEILRQHRCRLGGKIGIYAMPPQTMIEIDEPADLSTVEKILIQEKIRGACATGKCAIKALVLDVDGTLTDGGMYYGPGGEALKKFNTRDAKGIESLRQNGIQIGVITTENSAAVASRMQKLGIEEYYPGVRDKIAVLEKLCKKWNCRIEEVAYMGDDVGDLGCLAQAGLSCCPADAVPEVLAIANVVCSRPGGGGAVREVCDLILASLRALDR